MGLGCLLALEPWAWIHPYFLLGLLSPQRSTPCASRNKGKVVFCEYVSLPSTAAPPMSSARKGGKEGPLHLDLLSVRVGKIVHKERRATKQSRLFFIFHFFLPFVCCTGRIIPALFSCIHRHASRPSICTSLPLPFGNRRRKEAWRMSWQREDGWYRFSIGLRFSHTPHPPSFCKAPASLLHFYICCSHKINEKHFFSLFPLFQPTLQKRTTHQKHKDARTSDLDCHWQRYFCPDPQPCTVREPVLQSTTHDPVRLRLRPRTY